MVVDHYIVLGLPSGEEALKLSEEEIRKAYRLKALDLHPDKRPDDPHAHEKFRRLKTSYDVLKHEKTRKLFDDSLLRMKHEKQHKIDSKRRKMVSDLKKRKRSAFTPSDERLLRRFVEEVEKRVIVNLDCHLLDWTTGILGESLDWDLSSRNSTSSESTTNQSCTVEQHSRC
ncbi:unnamed protein product [Arabis nemorensis]|uniref:J domain-containing protein n=1 Tax=Arabis nemorensis TaxID=586526 RepID=A0A565CFN7_9BRAS|nr:unnamed protein product [Arabis nemorensis]